jgi:hypothetical protein
MLLPLILSVPLMFWMWETILPAHERANAQTVSSVDVKASLKRSRYQGTTAFP